jgi:membrane fusion protein, multidrug efflux system
MAMKLKMIIGIPLAAIVLVIGLRLTANKRTLAAMSRPLDTVAMQVPVKVALVAERQLDINIKKTGTLAAFEEAKVLAASSGTITGLTFQLGDRVRQGQVLAVMDRRLPQLALQKAATSLSKLKNDLETYTELYNGHATTLEKLDAIRQDYNDALNQYEQAKKQLDDADIRAPTDGIISVKAVEQGVYVNAGADIATVVNTTSIKVQVDLTESEVYQVKEGQQVHISADVYPNKIFTGRISFISPQGAATHSYPVEVKIDGDPHYVLHSGTFVNADFSRETRRHILVVPRQALAESVQNASVYVVEGSRARQRTIVTGREFGDDIEIVKGLHKNEEVVLSGQINLKDGAPITITQ